MRIVACYSAKGGVGKTASAVNLAWWCAARGRSTVLVDLDPQGASSFYFRGDPARAKAGKKLLQGRSPLTEHLQGTDYPNLDLLPAHKGFRGADALLAQADKPRRALADLLGALESQYDLVLLDCPPTLGLLAESIFAAADRILVPVTPSTLAERSYAQMLALYADQGGKPKRLRPFFTMVQIRKTLHRETMERMRAQYPRFARHFVPHARDVEYMGVHQAPLLAYAPRSVAAQAYHAIFIEHCGELIRSVA